MEQHETDVWVDRSAALTEGGRCTVVVGESGTELAVSRRHTRELRDLLVRRHRPGATGP